MSPLPVLLLALVALGGAGRAGAEILDDAAASDAALESRVHGALAGALTGDRAAVEHAADGFAADDAARAEQGRAKTGLTDDTRRLAAALYPSRAARLHALQGVLDDHPDPTVERLGQHELEADDGQRAQKLLADDAHNRRAGLLNDAVRPFGVLTGGALLAAINPILLAGSAVDSLATTVGNLWNWNQLTTPQREALVRYRGLLQQAPGSPDAQDAGRTILQLDAKRTKALCDDTVAQGEQAMDDGDLDRARFLLADARDLPGCAETAGKPLDQLAHTLAERATTMEAARWPVDDPVRPETDAGVQAHTALAAASAAGDADGMMSAARALLAVEPDGPAAPAARYAVAVARDMAGHHEAAREELDDVADESGSVGALARGALASPSFGAMAGLDAAERQHTGEVVRYVLFGGVDGRSAVYSATQIGAQGIDAAQSLGIVNVIGMATRAYGAWRKDPASNQTIIDRGEAMLARNPDGPHATEVHERLVDAYERAGNYERALMHLRATPDPSPRRVKALQEKLADQIMTDAKGSPAEPLILEAIVRHFPDSDAAETAQERLDHLPPPGELALDRDTLIANPRLMGPEALDLDPVLVDGNLQNGELEDKGVRLVPGGLRLALSATDDEPAREETRSLTPEAWSRARAAAEDLLYNRALAGTGHEEEVGVWEKYVPVFVQGSVGEDGLSVAPGIKMRRYQTDQPALYQ